MTTELTGNNPYVVGPPVTGENLYGRKDVFQFINESLAAPTNRLIVLHGQRRVGKSSILQELHLNRLSKEEYCTVRIDVQGEARTPFNTVIHDLATHIAEALMLKTPDSADYENDKDFFTDVFLPQALDSLGDRRLIIMIDEFDTLADENTAKDDADSTSAKFLPMLQDILSEDRFRQTVFILIIGCSLEKLPTSYTHLNKDGRFSRIWLLSRPDTETLITQPAENQLTYQQEAIDRIWFYSSGHPYFTQLLCYEAFNRAKRRQNPVINTNDIDRIIDKALETGRPAFVWLWDALNIAERLITSAVGSISFGEEATTKGEIQRLLKENRIRLGNVNLVEAMNHLVEERVLQLAGDDGYSFEVELVRLWVQKNHSIHQEKLKISEMSRSATSYYNVARQSHERGKFEAAIEGYRLALQDNPNHFGAQLGLARALYEADSLTEAVAEFEDAYWLNEEDSRESLVKARMALAESLEADKKHIEATVQYRRIREVLPNYRPFQEKLRILYDSAEQAQEKDNWSQAIEIYDRIIEIDPDYEDAAKKRDECWKKQREKLSVLYTSAEQAQEKDNWSQAIEIYDRIIEIDPDYEDAAKKRDECWKKQESRKIGSKNLLIAIGGIVVLILIGLIGGWYVISTGSTQTTPSATIIPVVDKEEITPDSLATATETTEKTDEPTEEPEPTGEVTIEPTDEPTEEPEPTGGVTIEPTDEPTEELEPTGEAADESTEEPELTEEQLLAPPTSEPQPLPDGEALDVDINPNNPNILFALLKDGSIYRTQDRGNAWKEIHPATSAGLSILIVAPNNPDIIYVGAFGKILKSTDNGNNWKESSLPGIVQIHDLAVAENNSNLVYAATEGGVLISQDGGETWVNGRSNGSDLIKPFYTVTITPNGTVFAAGQGDVIHRTDGPEANWQQLVCQPCDSEIYALAVSGSTVYAGGIRANLARSTNQGNDWILSNSGIPIPEIPTLNIASITINNQTIYVSTGFRATNANGAGIYRSEDGGNTWTHLSLPSNTQDNYHIQSIAIYKNNPDSIFIAGFDGVYKSEDGGYTWIRQ